MFISDYRQLATNLFSDIYQLSFDGVGVTRQSYGPGETAVADYLSRFAREEGLSVHIDRAANLISHRFCPSGGKFRWSCGRYCWTADSGCQPAREPPAACAG